MSGDEQRMEECLWGGLRGVIVSRIKVLAGCIFEAEIAITR